MLTVTRSRTPCCLSTFVPVSFRFATRAATPEESFLPSTTQVPPRNNTNTSTQQPQLATPLPENNMRLRVTTLLKPWFRLLDLPRGHPASWHQALLDGEMQEVREATSFIAKVSESSDVLFTICRAHSDGQPIARAACPPGLWNATVFAYMLGKFTSRWAFYRVAAAWCGEGKWRRVRDVTNPAKGSKVRMVAERGGIDPDLFERVCWRLRWVWPLFP